MATFSKKGFRKRKSFNGLITKGEMRDSKSSTAIAFKGMKNGQLTENSVIFDDVVKGSGVNIHISLFFREKAPYDFDVRAWFDNNTMVMKERISDLMLDVAFGKRFKELAYNNFKNLAPGARLVRLVRCITSDVVTGEREDVIGYLFHIEHNKY